MTKTAKTVFTDFDGVMYDSLREAYILCRWAYRNDSAENSMFVQEYDLFYKYKYLVNKTWQYYYLIKLLTDKTPDENIESEFYKLLENRDLEAEAEFEQKYLRKRVDLIANYLYIWDRLETPFPFSIALYQRLKDDEVDVVVVSQKDKFAIEYRLNQNGTPVPSEKIFGKEELADYETKAEFIDKYMKKNNIEKAYFVDDNSKNLEPCKDYPNITPILAGWGNIKQGEVGMSSREIFKLLDS